MLYHPYVYSNYPPGRRSRPMRGWMTDQVSAGKSTRMSDELDNGGFGGPHPAPMLRDEVPQTL